MTLDQLLFDIHVLEYELHSFERRFGVLSEIFYEAWSQGEEPADDSWVLPWAAWAGAYESWREYRQEYRDAVRRLNPEMKSLAETIGRKWGGGGKRRPATPERLCLRQRWPKMTTLA